MNLEDHFARKEPTPDVREAYRMLANAQLPNGVDVWKGGHGTRIPCELRFGSESNNVSLYRAVLNKNWVLWYFRKPAMTAGLFDVRGVLAGFPNAEQTDLGEVTLKLHNTKDAHDVIKWINAR